MLHRKDCLKDSTVNNLNRNLKVGTRITLRRPKKTTPNFRGVRRDRLRSFADPASADFVTSLVTMTPEQGSRLIPDAGVPRFKGVIPAGSFGYGTELIRSGVAPNNQAFEFEPADMRPTAMGVIDNKKQNYTGVVTVGNLGYRLGRNSTFEEVAVPRLQAGGVVLKGDWKSDGRYLDGSKTPAYNSLGLIAEKRKVTIFRWIRDLIPANRPKKYTTIFLRNAVVEKVTDGGTIFLIVREKGVDVKLQVKFDETTLKKKPAIGDEFLIEAPNNVP